MKDKLLALDIGTTAVKAVVFDLSGKITAVGSCEYDLEKPQVDCVELSAEIYLESTGRSIAQCLEKVAASEIAGVGVTGQIETLIMLDKNHHVLRKAIVWLDNRAKAEAVELSQSFDIEELYRITGQTEIMPCYPAPKILWLKKHQPEIFNKVDKYLMVEDFIAFHLTGAFKSCDALNVSSLFVDINQGCYYQKMLDYLGISTGQLPELVPTQAEIGRVKNRAFGLEDGTPVFAVPLDQLAGALGAGCVNESKVSECTGGALAICGVTSQRIFDSERKMGIFPYATGKNSSAILLWAPVGGMALRYFRDEFCGDLSYDEITAQAAKISPGSDGLTVLPHFAGAVNPESNPHAKAVFYGVTLAHNRAHFARAVMESIGYLLKDNLLALEKFGVKYDEVRSLGGGAKSELWLQIKADILNRKISVPECTEATALGTALIIGTGLKIFPNLELAAEQMVKCSRTITPDAEAVAAYQKAFEEYKAINTILWKTFKD